MRLQSFLYGKGKYYSLSKAKSKRPRKETAEFHFRRTAPHVTSFFGRRRVKRACVKKNANLLIRNFRRNNRITSISISFFEPSSTQAREKQAKANKQAIHPVGSSFNGRRPRQLAGGTHHCTAHSPPPTTAPRTRRVRRVSAHGAQSARRHACMGPSPAVASARCAGGCAAGPPRARARHRGAAAELHRRRILVHECSVQQHVRREVHPLLRVQWWAGAVERGVCGFHGPHSCRQRICVVECICNSVWAVWLQWDDGGSPSRHIVRFWYAFLFISFLPRSSHSIHSFSCTHSCTFVINRFLIAKQSSSFPHLKHFCIFLRYISTATTGQLPLCISINKQYIFLFPMHINSNAFSLLAFPFLFLYSTHYYSFACFQQHKY